MLFSRPCLFRRRLASYRCRQPCPMYLPSSAMLTPFVLFLGLLPCTFAYGTLQRVVVRGRIICGNESAGDIQMKLFDKDLGFDDLLDEQRSNATGHFLLDGFTREWSDIEPVLKIYHDCNDALWCQRRLRLYVPKKYINKGERTDLEHDIAAGRLKILDVGLINLETYFWGEDRDCFHK